MNWLCRRPTPAFWGRTAPELGGHFFACDLRDGIAREVCFTRRYEPQETALLAVLLRAGMTFVDVGANWGYFSLLAAGRLGPGGRVVSLEPDPRLFALLRANLDRNGLASVVARQAAAADAVGTLRLAAFDEDAGNWGLSRLTDRPAAETFAVAAVPLDGLMDELGVGHVDLLKMDIEGAEDLALDGMRDGLWRCRYRRLLLEVHPALLAERGRTAQDVFARLEGAGYRAWRIDHSPAATRRAAYAAVVEPISLLRPLGSRDELDSWPHLLWAAPGFEPEALRDAPARRVGG
jgi:FkbM family methyltransferase